MIKRKPKKAWAFSKKQRVDLLNLIVALCTLLIASRQALGISDTFMGIITVTGGMAIAFLKLSGNQAIDEALNTSAPRDQENIAVLQDALLRVAERIKEGTLPAPKGESGSISVPAPPASQGDTLPGYMAGQ
jgi:hypothetical protein